ncbi:unnamed protein product [Alopecurus aequalis]
MEIILPVVLGELVTRSMTLFRRRYSNPPAAIVENSLERILLRAQVIIDEAAGRQITNQGMLRQLSMLRNAVYRGSYVLDIFRCSAHREGEVKEKQVVPHSWALSKFNFAKRFRLPSDGNTQTLQELERVLDSLRTMILDVSELVIFLTTYPRLHRQPYSTHLLLEKCMFGRQMEMELVINFLLQTQACSGSILGRCDVLPIIGPGRVGKSTLVAHVCDDQRVRHHFSQIVFLRHDNFRDKEIAASRNECAVRDEYNFRLLVVVEVVGDLQEDVLDRLCSLSRRCTRTGSKIIITSRSDKIRKLGTTQALTLKHLPEEAYWYYFKVITFGGTNPDMHPKLAYLAMEIARVHNGSIFAANITACLLRANFDILYWRKVLAFLRGYVEKHLSMFGEHPCDMLEGNIPTCIQRMGRTTEDFGVLDQYQTYSSQEEVPKITIQDVMYGGVKPHGTFKVLACKSQIPPYHCYIYTCKIRDLQTRVIKRKQSLNR